MTEPPDREPDELPRLQDDPALPLAMRKLVRDWSRPAELSPTLKAGLADVRETLAHLQAHPDPTATAPDEEPPRLQDDPALSAAVRKLVRDWSRPAELSPTLKAGLAEVRQKIARLEAGAVEADELDEEPPRLQDDPALPPAMRKLVRDWSRPAELPASMKAALAEVRETLKAPGAAEPRSGAGAEKAPESLGAEASGSTGAKGLSLADRAPKKRSSKRATRKDVAGPLAPWAAWEKVAAGMGVLAAAAVLVLWIRRDPYPNTAAGRPLCMDLPNVGRSPAPRQGEEGKHLEAAHRTLRDASDENELFLLVVTLDADRERYGESPSQDEREALLLRALWCQAYQRTDAWPKMRVERDGKAFLDKYPRSPYVGAVRRMLDSLPR